jgi:hypothetical protein
MMNRPEVTSYLNLDTKELSYNFSEGSAKKASLKKGTAKKASPIKGTAKKASLKKRTAAKKSGVIGLVDLASTERLDDSGV